MELLNDNTPMRTHNYHMFGSDLPLYDTEAAPDEVYYPGELYVGLSVTHHTH
jgi:hypothetical protein